MTMKILFLIMLAAAVFLCVFFLLSSSEKLKKSQKKADLKKLNAKFKAMTNSRKRVFIALTVFFVTGILLQNIIFALIACILYAYFDWQIKRKQALKTASLIDKQVIEALTIIKNAVCSGQSLTQAIDIAAGELKEPIKTEFVKMSEKLALGANFDVVLAYESENAPSREFGLMIDTIRISKDSGAALADVFDRIISVTSQRIGIRSKVDALTAQGRLSGNLVSIIPFVVILMIYMIEPGMVSSLFTTFIGNLLLLFVVIMVLVGSFAIRKLTEIDF